MFIYVLYTQIYIQMLLFRTYVNEWLNSICELPLPESYLKAFFGEFLLFMADFLVSLLYFSDYKIHACTCKLLHGSGTRMLNTHQELDPLTAFPCVYSCCTFLRTFPVSTFPVKLGYIKIFNIVLQDIATKIFELRLKIKVICQSLNR